MTTQMTKTLTIILSTLGVLCFISTGFGIFPFKYAAFAGIACFLIAGMFRRVGMQS